MKICILTQPLYTNYGGILQNYALQFILKSMGHEVWTENRTLDKLSIGARIRRISWFRRLMKKSKYPAPSLYYRKIIGQHTKIFIDKYITLTRPVNSSTMRDIFQTYDFDAYIVGSDQVWRPTYSPCITNYFLDFTCDDNVKRIAYAASFGTSDWEFSKEERIICRKLLEKFDAVSVREDSAVELCAKYFSVKAEQVLDPTMLLEKEDYMHLLDDNLSNVIDLGLMVYFLDYTEKKQQMVVDIMRRTKLKVVKINPPLPRESFFDVGPKGVSNCIFPPVTKWIEGFYKSIFVITDSFHGTVFSIIFNKPFIVIANKERGNDRFYSLLKLFNLESRLIEKENQNWEEILDAPISWKSINEKRALLKKYSICFLKNSLSC